MNPVLLIDDDDSGGGGGGGDWDAELAAALLALPDGGEVDEDVDAHGFAITRAGAAAAAGVIAAHVDASGGGGGASPMAGPTGSVVDPALEVLDPTPDVRSLFTQFDAIYFGGALAGCEVRWSPRMTRCAGLCVYQRVGGFCSIRLSQPLLRLRPRSDTVNTLLHEMIHALLFVTHADIDRDGHGAGFQQHMHRLNAATGSQITVFHTFHQEVRGQQGRGV
jgi:hypothetical protein